MVCANENDMAVTSEQTTIGSVLNDLVVEGMIIIK